MTPSSVLFTNGQNRQFLFLKNHFLNSDCKILRNLISGGKKKSSFIVEYHLKIIADPSLNFFLVFLWIQSHRKIVLSYSWGSQWCCSLILCLWYWHPTWKLVHVRVVLLPKQILANGQGNGKGWITSLVPCTHVGDMEKTGS